MAGLGVQHEHVDQPLGERLEREDRRAHGQIGDSPRSETDAHHEGECEHDRDEPWAGVAEELARFAPQVHVVARGSPDGVGGNCGVSHARCCVARCR